MTLTEAIAVAAEAREIGLLSRFPKAACVLADEVARLRGIVPLVLEKLNDDLCAENEALRKNATARVSSTYEEWRDTYSKYGMFNEAMARAAWDAAIK